MYYQKKLLKGEIMNIFITGASKGIGRATALFFAEKGWFIGVTDIDRSGLAKLEKELAGKKYFAAIMDVTDSDGVAKTFNDFCTKTGGKLDVLFNNAGVAWLDPFESVPLQNHHAMINVNVTGVLNCIFHAFPYLKKAQGARVINMCSAAAHYGVAWEVTYSATKFFIRGLTEALNLEWERHDIHVCDIMPNFVDTPMMEHCRSKVVDNVGIKLTTQDVVNAVWKAAHKKRVNWLVEFFPYNILQPLAQYTPRFIVRRMMKKKAGL
jgi:NAD(P)-dependent dehydrogenase (short-subunit alcohol dehydrogenase family)